MNKTSILVFSMIILLIGTPHPVKALQIAPNPNPAGSTIDIVNDPSAFNSDNPFTNAGTINIVGGSASTLTNNAGATFTNVGSIQNGGRLTNDTGGTMTSSGVLSNNGIMTNNGTLTNSGGLSTTFALTNNGTLTNSGGLGNSGTLTNNGTLTNSGTLTTLNGGFIANSGSFTNSGTLEGLRGGTFNSGTFTNSGTLTNWAGSSFGNGVGATLTNTGTFNSYDNTNVLSNQGTVTNAGTLVSYGSVSNADTLINTGSLTSLLFLTNTGTILNNGQLSNADGWGGFYGPPVVTNTGSIIGTGSYTQTSGKTVNNGTLAQTSILINGGTLSGTGTITGDVTIGSGGTVAPGSSPATFTVNGDFISSGNTLFEIAGLGPGLFDVLNINGNAFFNGGTVRFNFLNFDPSIGNSWNFLYANAITGWDTQNFLFTGLGAGETTQFSFANGLQTLTIIPVPEPESLLFLACGLAALAGWRLSIRN